METVADLGADEDALHSFLAPVLGEARRETFQVRRLNAGHSNLTFAIEADGRSYVLRRPPLGPLAPTAHDVLREHAVLERLAGSDLPTPVPVVACDDASVIGAPFYVMHHVEGVVVRERVPHELASAAARTAISYEAVDRLAQLHDLDWRAAGFHELAPSTGFLDRQLRRWSRQWEHNRTREITDLEMTARWLAAERPRSAETTLVHGDYKLDNLMFEATSAWRCLAVFDWEMATLGDPLADLGWLLAWWPEAGDDVPTPLRVSAATAEGGFLSRDEICMRYAERRGVDVVGVTHWYEVLALWKLAILFEGSYRRYLAGTTDDEYFAVLDDGVPELAAEARRRAHARA